MASSIQPKRRPKKKLNGLPNDLFTRLQFVIAFDDHPPQQSAMSPSPLPPDSSNSRITKPIHPYILPLLLTAHHARVDVRQSNIVSERNLFRKLAMNDEDSVITIIRFDTILFLRRYPVYHKIDRNDPGFRFEQMCTTNDGDYPQLIEGQIGELITLMLGKTDSIRRENGDSIELKCQRRDLGESMGYNWWSQAFRSKWNLKN
jgi:hypothetical protein